jgi:hypothetical protein
MFEVPNSIKDLIKEIGEDASKKAAKYIEVEQFLGIIHKEIENIPPQVLPILEIEQFKVFTEVLKEEAKHIPKVVDKVNRYLADRGWFVPFHYAGFSIFEEYEQLINEERHDLIETKTQDYITKNFPKIKSQAERYFDKRYSILNSAFEAKKHQNFELSIPVLLAQADGMFEELIGTTFYSNNEKHLRKTKKNLLANLAKSDHPKSTNSLSYLLLKQLGEKSLLHEDYEKVDNRIDRNPNLNPLNRNKILHGKDLMYGTEPNSLRSISLIGLLCSCKEVFNIS